MPIGHDAQTRAILDNLSKRHTHQVVKETMPAHIAERVEALEAHIQELKDMCETLKSVINHNAEETVASFAALGIKKTDAA